VQTGLVTCRCQDRRSEVAQDWDIRPCGSTCCTCERPFVADQEYQSLLVFSEEELDRRDYCCECWKAHSVDDSAGEGSWKGVFRPPAPPPEEALKKETAENLLRKLIATEDDANGNVIYLLAVMLERKKMLVERDRKKDDEGNITLVFEYRKTGEVFLVPDPQLQLDQLGHVQREVSQLLGGGGSTEGPESGPSNSPPDEESDADDQGEENN